MGGIGAVSTSGVTTELTNILAGRDTRWYKGHLLKLTLILILPLITSATNGYDGSMMNGLQTLKTWDDYFGNPLSNSKILGIFNAIQSIGAILGLPFAPWCADRLGRRGAIFVGATIAVAATIIQTCSQNVAMFIVARGLLGAGVSLASIASPILITELAFPSHRAPITSLYNSSWYLGSIVAAWTTYGTFRINSTWSWRIPSLLQGVPSLLQMFLIYTIPESPRWQVSKGKDELAIAFLAKHHCGGDSNDPLIMYEYEEIKESLRLEQEAASSSSWKDLFTNKGNLRRLRIIIAVAFFSQWSGNGLVSYYLTKVLKGIGITETGHQTLINGILQVYNYFWAIVGALTVDKVGRRFLFLTSTTGMCVAFICWTICSALYTKSAQNFDPACVAENDGNTSKCIPIGANKSAGNGVLAFIFLFYGFYDIAMSPLLVSYTIEILPFRVRSKGLMMKSLTVNIALVFNQYVNPIALDALNWKYYIVFCVFLAFEVVYIYFFLIETRGADGPLPLEEISLLFDGPGYYGFQKRPTLPRNDVETPIHDKTGSGELIENVPYKA